jgi:hypothetical protein
MSGRSVFNTVLSPPKILEVDWNRAELDRFRTRSENQKDCVHGQIALRRGCMPVDKPVRLGPPRGDPHAKLAP